MYRLHKEWKGDCCQTERLGHREGPPKTGHHVNILTRCPLPEAAESHAGTFIALLHLFSACTSSVKATSVWRQHEGHPLVEQHGKHKSTRVRKDLTIRLIGGLHGQSRNPFWMSVITSTARRKKRKAIEQQVIATSQHADGSQETIEETTVEIAAPGVKKQRAKKVIVERGDALRSSYAIQTSQGKQGACSGGLPDRSHLTHLTFNRGSNK